MRAHGKVKGQSKECEQNFTSHLNVIHVSFQQDRGSGSDVAKILEIVRSVRKQILISQVTSRKVYRRNEATEAG